MSASHRILVVAASTLHRLPFVLAFVVTSAGCGHTVGAMEVATRAAFEFSCDGTTVAVQTVARNHYRATGCAKGAVFICRGGVCERDSEVLVIPDGARANADAQRSHAVLDAVRDRILTCTGGRTFRVEVAFGEDGRQTAMTYIDELPLGPRICVDDVLGDIEMGGQPEYPIFVRHVFSS